MVGGGEGRGAGTDRRRRRVRPIKGGLLPSLLGYHLRRAQTAVFQSFRTATEEFDITPGQLGVLILIDANDGLSQSELGEAMGIDRSTMVAVIDRLERRDLVVRAPSPSDRRSYALRLSTQGVAMLAGVLPAVRRHESSVAETLTPDERETLISLLKKFADGPGG